MDRLCFFSKTSVSRSCQEVVLLNLVNLLLRQTLTEASMGRGIDGSRGEEIRGEEGE